MDPIASPTSQTNTLPTPSAKKPSEEIHTPLHHADPKMKSYPTHQASEKPTQSYDAETPSHPTDPEPGLALTSPTPTSESPFPEGGPRAWLVVLSAFLMLFPSFGLQVSIGTLQDHWSQHQLSSMSSRDIGWIPSLFVYLSLALGIWVGPLFDRVQDVLADAALLWGSRWILVCGADDDEFGGCGALV
ncbi:hypothetical protein GGP41_010016 [Bipolaris sorokiniana]|uniref:Major facilitator superfamily (MFS) profile domain-containing protein n=1 Tax=Cochliobolus sativus TaxID=45130 RepID=A0A8H6DUY3_COCSA|nr:hypothetical protein GGP41_010016 [Bipolaris sorokiniana]